jgi:iron complex outermembrane receptor protein
MCYVEALERGGTAGETTANAGEVMSPLKSKQIEAGVKVEQANWSATAAVFRMQRAAEYVNAA